jgi:hypothetical protein
MGNILKTKCKNNNNNALAFDNIYFDNHRYDNELYNNKYYEYQDTDCMNRVICLEDKFLSLSRENFNLKKELSNVNKMIDMYNNDLDSLLNNDKYLYAKIDYLEKELKRNNINIRFPSSISDTIDSISKNNSFLSNTEINNLEYDD